MQDFIPVSRLTEKATWVKTEPGCGACRGLACCEIAPPFLTQEDIKRISDRTGLFGGSFAKKMSISDGRTFSQMKGTEDGVCFFFDKSTRRCKIYESRPTDCRLFPLDIKVIDSRPMWILHNCALSLQWSAFDIAALLELAKRELLPRLILELGSYSEESSVPLDSQDWIILEEVGEVTT